MKRIFLGALVLSTCYSAQADMLECVALKTNNSIEVNLKRTESFNNCLSLDEVPANTPIQIVGMSGSSVKNKITVHQLHADGSSSYVAEYASANDSSNMFRTNSTNRMLSLRVVPTTHLNSDKKLTATLIGSDGKAVVFLELDDIPSTEVTPPPRTGGCTFTNGRRICYEER